MRDSPGYREAAEKEDGYRLWLRYEPLLDGALRSAYRSIFGAIHVAPGHTVLDAARDELLRGLDGLLGREDRVASSPGAATMIAGTSASCPEVALAFARGELEALGPEGFAIARPAREGRARLVLGSAGPAGLLYGAFRLLAALQAGTPPEALTGSSRPRIALRMLDHWDNLDRTVERGYAGFSIWDWHRLPDIVSPRYRDYARANASIGINAASLANVNADALLLREDYLDKAAAIAAELRPFAIRVFLTARFDAPMELGGLPDADPLSPAVASWWAERARLVYGRIPDFGGFLVKANSEGQPGPQDYGRSHADGANMLARALAPFGGTVLWRAFVYSAESPTDRAKQAYEEFVPLDGRFEPGVVLQVKNGPIDFQPREPVHPLFGAMRDTPLALELQATQEYLGCSTHLAYLGPLYEEALDADTFRDGPGTTVARVLDGSARPAGAIAAVANVGEDRDWCGHPFAAANWFAFGRLAWDPGLGSGEIALEWSRLTFSRDGDTASAIARIMMASREAVVDYMTPLGLCHLMARDHHYGPGPWVEGGRPDWTSVYFHRADAGGIGFDRGPTGSDAVSQYAPPLRELYSDPGACPEELLLFFHHLPWARALRSGETLWDGLCRAYQRGVDSVRLMGAAWAALEGRVDPFRHERVSALLRVQEREAVWWKDACLAYFASISGRPFPEGVEPPARDLAHYRSIESRNVPGLGRIR